MTPGRASRRDRARRARVHAARPCSRPRRGRPFRDAPRLNPNRHLRLAGNRDAGLQFHIFVKTKPRGRRLSPPKHLRRLDEVWVDAPIYFITTSTASRRPILANEIAATILRDEFEMAAERHGWLVGRFVIMPDRIHFFCAMGDARSRNPVAVYGRLQAMEREADHQGDRRRRPVRRAEFFDRVLRSHERYARKWRYVLENPVRAGLVAPRAVARPLRRRSAPLCPAWP